MNQQSMLGMPDKSPEMLQHNRRGIVQRDKSSTEYRVLLKIHRIHTNIGLSSRLRNMRHSFRLKSDRNPTCKILQDKLGMACMNQEKFAHRQQGIGQMGRTCIQHKFPRTLNRNQPGTARQDMLQSTEHKFLAKFVRNLKGTTQKGMRDRLYSFLGKKKNIQKDIGQLNRRGTEYRNQSRIQNNHSDIDPQHKQGMQRTFLYCSRHIQSGKN
jgi:hypothetical protein